MKPFMQVNLYPIFDMKQSFLPPQWRYKLPMLQDFPLATMSANSLDELFPAVGWQMFVAERMIQRYLIFPRWFENRLQSARHSHIPVCNLGSDSLTTILDVVFARQLVHNRHLLWASERSASPDLGGAERDEHLFWTESLVYITISLVFRFCVALNMMMERWSRS